MSLIKIMDAHPVVLAGPHIRLEPLEMAHLAGLASILDATLLQYFQKPARNAAELQIFIETALEEQRQGRSLPFAIIESAGGRPVGSTRLANIDRDNRRLEIGWSWIGRAWQRTAVNTEAKLLLMTHAFETLGVNRIEFKTDSLNTQSREALTRLGAVEEGYFRNHLVMSDGRLRHSVWFSIVASEWPRVKHQLQTRLEAAPSGHP